MALTAGLADQTATKGGGGPLVERRFLLAFAVVTSLFFMWAIANNFNDILIKQFQKALELSRMQSGLVQTAFYFGYFTFAIPAGWAITRFGYKAGIIAGCYVIDGTISRASAGVRVLRDHVVIYEGKLGSLRRFKDDVREVQQGYECGIGVENFSDVKPGDILEVYTLDKVAAKL